jgi:hypothetical protein
VRVGPPTPEQRKKLAEKKGMVQQPHKTKKNPKKRHKSHQHSCEFEQATTQTQQHNDASHSTAT